MKLWQPVVLALVVLAAGCKEETPIVIKFEPNDLAAAKPAVASGGDAGLRAAVDAAPAAAPSPSPSPSPSAKPHAKAEAAACKTAADCVLAPADCCDCANGGAQVVIARTQLAAHQAARQKKCTHVMCTQVFSTDPTCGKRPDCVQGHCAIGDLQPGGKKR